MNPIRAVLYTEREDPTRAANIRIDKLLPRVRKLKQLALDPNFVMHRTDNELPRLIERNTLNSLPNLLDDLIDKLEPRQRKSKTLATAF